MSHHQGPNLQTSVHPDEYMISIRDCNSITEGRITLQKGKLNIKYGPNGIGKSTIARAIALNTQGQEALDELLPFKFRQQANPRHPAIEGADAIKNVSIFNEDYVSKFVFQPDEVIRSSFEIFIKTQEYDQGIEELENLFKEVREFFSENDALDAVIEEFAELHGAFKTTVAGTIARNSIGYRALDAGGKLENIPKALQDFKNFLRSDDPAGWLSWQSKGKNFLSLSNNCPFCSARDVDKKPIIEVSKTYETSAVKNMSKLRVVIEKLAGFFEPAHLNQLGEITKTLDPLSPDQEAFLINLRGQIETLLDKFKALKNLSFASLRDSSDVKKTLLGLKIDLGQLNTFRSTRTQAVVSDLNDQLDHVARRISEIQRNIGIQKSRVAESIRQNEDEVNSYLSSAGYKYTVRIESREDSYRMILEHEESAGHLENATSHLSFGERNAFALVLFMHQVQREKPDLVILDDPVSSFDKTKKYAILHKLFHGKRSLRGFTILLLTHDIEPAIDTIRTATSGQFKSVAPSVHFLINRNGNLSEKPITRSDIMTFSQVCRENIKSNTDPAIKCIYLRRLYEIDGNLGDEHDILSSLLHLRDHPTRKDHEGNHTPLAEADIERALKRIQEDIPEFDYYTILADLKSLDNVISKFKKASAGYEKVQLFRIAYENNHSLGGDSTFKKFVNETYHIENEYVMQLNPREFDAVPEHIISTCSQLLGKATNGGTS